MPSKSPAQHRFMAAVAHNPKFAAKVGVAPKVGKDFVAADASVGAKAPAVKSGLGIINRTAKV